LVKYLFLLFLFSYQNIFSQNSVSGIVVNGTDNSKLVAASVFINNSAKGTITDNDGKFILNTANETDFELIISYAGFATVSIKITYQNIQQFNTIKLFPRKQELQEVSITPPEKDGWQKWGRLFTDNFIGTSDFAQECTIKNPEVIKFFYNKKTRLLKAYSQGSINIYNKALGYNIHYQLEDFEKNSAQQTIVYYGYTRFEDLDTKNKHKEKKWQKNRSIAYNGSLMHFMRALYAGNIAEQGFEVREKLRVKNDDSAFAQIYRNGNIPEKVRIDTNEYIPIVYQRPNKIPDYIDLVSTKPFSFAAAVKKDSAAKNAFFYFADRLRIIYKNAKEKMEYLQQNLPSVHTPSFQNSDIYLINNEAIEVEPNGVYFNPVNMLCSGYWGWCKMAETLPTDYNFNGDVEKF
jgi:hypothetical protein